MLNAEKLYCIVLCCNKHRLITGRAYYYQLILLVFAIHFDLDLPCFQNMLYQVSEWQGLLNAAARCYTGVYTGILFILPSNNVW